MKLSDLISKVEKKKLNQITSPKKKHKKKQIRPPIKQKEEKINWHEIMNSNKRGMKRGPGGAWRNN